MFKLLFLPRGFVTFLALWLGYGLLFEEDTPVDKSTATATSVVAEMLAASDSSGLESQVLNVPGESISRSEMEIIHAQILSQLDQMEQSGSPAPSQLWSLEQSELFQRFLK